ncbi:hypothetical protein ACFMQL_24585 [Nonomuraea fastidiosa]|uniref:hypothetical protein n=1 Tax=Nonomuraea TaxID=83681 RepID=UPI003252FAE5
MATCPQGHASGADDYCDVCGIQMAPPARPVSRPQPRAQAPQPETQAQPAENCPICQTPRAGQFCEVCGHDFTGATPAPSP